MRIHIGGTSNTYNLDSITVVPMLDYATNGSSIDFTWPPNQSGWYLASETNLLENNWLPIAGSENTNTWSESISAGPDTRFFRLSSP